MLEDNFKDIYNQAIKNASVETWQPKSTFPNDCEFTIDELLDVDFIDNFINEQASKSTNPYFDYIK